MAESVSLFTYGTLVHPAILSRVLSGSLKIPATPHSEYTRDSEITVVPALLTGHEIRRVKGQEYPALLQNQESVESFEAQAIRQPVRGVVIHGLTHREIEALDRFEGDEYVRVNLDVLVPLSETPITNEARSKWDASTIEATLDSSLPPARVESLLSGVEPSNPLQVQGYLWTAPKDELEQLHNGPRGPWTFIDFARSRSHRWTSGEWSDHGGPDGESDQSPKEGTSNVPPAIDTRPGISGFDEVQRSLSYDGSKSSEAYPSASFSSLSIGTDPWADKSSETSAPRTIPANPWANDEEAQSLSSGNDAVSKAPPGPDSHLGRRVGGQLPPGFPLELEGQEIPGFQKFGKSARHLWHHGDPPQGGGRSYLNMNHGAFGSCPKPVMEAYNALSIRAEVQPDQFRRRTVPEMLHSIKAKLSERFKVDPATLAIIRNSTTGTNAILRGIEWQPGDHILCIGSIYGALDKTIDYIAETHPNAPQKTLLPITFPVTHDDMVAAFDQHVRKLKDEGKLVRLAAFDAISSHPGVVMPWERLVAKCREHGVLSMVDGAHAMGQIAIDLGTARPDFFVTNAHKWNFAHRGCAVLYVPFENQKLVPSSLPTSWGFRPKASRLSRPEAWQGQDFFLGWKDPGTDDYSPLLSLDTALEFQTVRLGGEERVRKYNRSLALLGGLRVSQILGTEILETNSEPTLTASMVNVRLPLVSRIIGTDASDWLWGQGGGEQYFFDTLSDDFATNIPVLVHNQQVYARLSAQVYLELEDFEYAGRALKEVCRRINEGEYGGGGQQGKNSNGK